MATRHYGAPFEHRSRVLPLTGRGNPFSPGLTTGHQYMLMLTVSRPHRAPTKTAASHRQEQWHGAQPAPPGEKTETKGACDLRVSCCTSAFWAAKEQPDAQAFMVIRSSGPDTCPSKARHYEPRGNCSRTSAKRRRCQDRKLWQKPPPGEPAELHEQVLAVGVGL